MPIRKFETMCFLLSAREVFDDVPTSSAAHAIHDFHGFPEQNGYRSLTRLSPVSVRFWPARDYTNIPCFLKPL